MFKYNLNSKNSFNVLELLMTMSIIMILIVVMVTFVQKFRSKTLTLHTKQTFNIISQALELYKNASNIYPVITTIDDQHKLYNSLSGDFTIYDKAKNKVKTIKKPFLKDSDIESLIDENILKKIGPNYYFCDSWENPIFYFYSGPNFQKPIDINDHPHPDKTYEHNSQKYNVNSTFNLYDLISKGQKDDSSFLKDDITNYQ